MVIIKVDMFLDEVNKMMFCNLYMGNIGFGDIIFIVLFLGELVCFIFNVRVVGLIELCI